MRVVCDSSMLSKLIQSDMGTTLRAVEFLCRGRWRGVVRAASTASERAGGHLIGGAMVIWPKGPMALRPSWSCAERKSRRRVQLPNSLKIT